MKSTITFNKEEKMQNAVKTGIVLWDGHYPYHDKEAFNSICNFIKDQKPDIIGLGGDWLDLSIVSHWNTDKERERAGRTLYKDYDGLNKDVITKLEKLSNWSDKFYLTGNHEDFIEQYIDKNPQLEGLIEFDECLNLKKRGWKVVPLNDHYQIGKMSFIHGFYTNQYHAKKTIDTWGDDSCIFYGHVHDIQSQTVVFRGAHGLPRMAQSCGCLCNKNPDYLKNKPNKWVHAFLFFTIRADGTFTHFVIPIINGHFSFGRKTY